MGVAVKKTVVLFLLLTAMILFSINSYGGEQEDEIVIDLSNNTIEQEAPGSEKDETEESEENTRENQSSTQKKAQKDGEEPVPEETAGGVSCGFFEITGYCNCEICTGENQLTFWETTPRAGHTAAADLEVFPLGTKLMIDGEIYVVEDTGTALTGKKIDIFYETHEEALESGRRQAEVFRIEEKDEDELGTAKE